MKIVSTTGCTCDSLTVDGVETINMKVEDLQEVVKKVVEKTTDIGLLQNTLINLVECIGGWEYLGHCEDCGDSIDQYTLEV